MKSSSLIINWTLVRSLQNHSLHSVAFHAAIISVVKHFKRFDAIKRSDKMFQYASLFWVGNDACCNSQNWHLILIALVIINSDLFAHATHFQLYLCVFIAEVISYLENQHTNLSISIITQYENGGGGAKFKVVCHHQGGEDTKKWNAHKKFEQKLLQYFLSQNWQTILKCRALFVCHSIFHLNRNSKSLSVVVGKWLTFSHAAGSDCWKLYFI